MEKLSEAAKEAIVKKALSLSCKERKELADSHNIGYSTVSKWLEHYRKMNTQGTNPRSTKYPNLAYRIKHVLATSNLNESELGTYCRTQGLYAVQLETWKQDLMTMNADEEKKNKIAQTELKLLKSEIEQLKIELRRKDKALAETAALLVLKKKAHAIWGGHPED